MGIVGIGLASVRYTEWRFTIRGRGENRSFEMRIVVIADSQFGNTNQIAQAIGRGASTVGEVAVLLATEADVPALLAERIDLLFLGGPTVNRRMSPALEGCVDAAAAAGRDLVVATFDTRFRGSELLMGSAARKAARQLERAGARLVAPKESFFVVRAQAPQGVRTPPGMARLADGEEARAEAWGRRVAALVAG
jgi:flavodoxin